MVLQKIENYNINKEGSQVLRDPVTVNNGLSLEGKVFTPIEENSSLKTGSLKTGIWCLLTS